MLEKLFKCDSSDSRMSTGAVALASRASTNEDNLNF